METQNPTRRTLIIGIVIACLSITGIGLWVGLAVPNRQEFNASSAKTTKLLDKLDLKIKRLAEVSSEALYALQTENVSFTRQRQVFQNSKTGKRYLKNAIESAFQEWNKEYRFDTPERRQQWSRQRWTFDKGWYLMFYVKTGISKWWEKHVAIIKATKAKQPDQSLIKQLKKEQSLIVDKLILENALHAWQPNKFSQHQKILLKMFENSNFELLELINEVIYPFVDKSIFKNLKPFNKPTTQKIVGVKTINEADKNIFWYIVDDLKNISSFQHHLRLLEMPPFSLPALKTKFKELKKHGIKWADKVWVKE